MSGFRFLTIFILCYSVCFSQPDDTVTAGQSFTVSGTITNFQPGKTMYFALYTSQENLDNRNFYRKVIFEGHKLQGDSVHFAFTDVVPGEYIIAGYQDINGDGKMNMGLFGPKEPYRIHEPNYGLFGPKFNKCKFRVSGNIDTVIIVLK